MTAGNYTRPGMTGGARGGSFEERMRELSRLVGQGKITTKVTVAQAYARRQHQNQFYAHPRGGGPFFLHNALMQLHKAHIQRVAQELFRGNVQVLYIRFGENVADQASGNTPKELDNLQRSYAVDVKVGGRTIYRREPQQRRMTRAELNSRVRLYHRDKLKRRFNS
jgi:hypothetical protein